MESIKLEKYKTFMFDCDGVILNSNKTKSDAFYKSILHYGEELAYQFKEYHKQNGGISRQEKYDFLIDELAPKYKRKIKETNYDLCKKFSEIINEDLLTCEISQSLKDLRESYKSSNWLVVSGGNEKELNDLFQYRDISNYFNKGIFGNPRSKYQIISDYMKDDGDIGEVIFIGDSKHDYEVATYYNFDFLFMSEWTEVHNWKSWIALKNIKQIHNLKTLLRSQ